MSRAVDTRPNGSSGRTKPQELVGKSGDYDRVVGAGRSTFSKGRDMKCRFCNSTLRVVDGELVDELGESCCETYYDWCPACQDGEPHPHERIKRRSDRQS